MYAFKNLMIGLDFSLLDPHLIQYTASIAETIHPQRIYFVHVQRDLDVPDDVREFMLNPETPVDEMLVSEIKGEVHKHFVNQQDYDIEYEVIEGSPTKEMLRWSHIKNIDLLIMGRKSKQDGSGIVSRMLARKVRSSVLFVPEGASFQLNRLVVPVDFSIYSKMAIEEATVIKSENSDVLIQGLHVYSLPSGYYYSGKTSAEFSEILEKNAKKRMLEFMREIKDPGIEMEYVLDEKHNPAFLINQKAHDFNADLIIAGARGRSMAAAILLGSVTEKLLILDADIPLLVVKRQDKTFNFWDTIQSL